MKHKKLVFALSVVCVIILEALTLFLVMGEMKCSSVIDSINGKTYSGSAVTDLSHYNIRITFTDDEFCDVYYEEYIDGICYPDEPHAVRVPYKIKGNMFNTYLEWDDNFEDGAAMCSGRFNVRYKSSDEVYFYNSDYSNTFIDLEEGANNFDSVYQNSSSGSFTNKYGTSTTKCAVSGCSNYIAKSGDTNCCTTHSNKCGNCYCYIDGDAMYCMDCLEDALGGSGSNSGSSYGHECYICGDSAYSKYGSYYYCSDCLDLVKKFSD